MRWLALLLLLFCSTAGSAAAAISAVNTWSNFSSGAVTSGVAIDTSTGTQAKVGDVLVAFFIDYNTVTMSPPLGWSTTVPMWAVGPMQAVVYHKVVAAGDIGATFTFTTGGVSAFVSAGISCWRGVDNANPIDAAGTGSGTTDTLHTMPTAAITVIKSRAALLWFGTQDFAVGAPIVIPATFSPLWNIDTLSTVEGSTGAYLASVAPGSTGTITGNYTSSVNTVGWQSVLVALGPAPTINQYVKPTIRLGRPHPLRTWRH